MNRLGIHSRAGQVKTAGGSRPSKEVINGDINEAETNLARGCTRFGSSEERHLGKFPRVVPRRVTGKGVTTRFDTIGHFVK